jgi:predicted O-methyltransferase YrrM
MRKAIVVVLAAVCGLGALAAVAADATKDKTSQAFREKFVKDFNRIGLNTAPGDAMMLRILVEAAKCKRGVEVGSATGFGAVNMGIAFERTGGQLFTIDYDKEMVAATKENLAKVGLEKVVTCIESDALKALPTIEGPIDFAFLDALKKDYLKYLQLIEPKLKVGAVVVADNVIKSAKEMKDYLDYVQTSPNYDTVIIRSSMDKDDGMAISYKIR